MRKSNTHRGTALAARFAGLGMATAVTLALGTLPATALADEAAAGDVPVTTADVSVESLQAESEPASEAEAPQAIPGVSTPQAECDVPSAPAGDLSADESAPAVPTPEKTVAVTDQAGSQQPSSVEGESRVAEGASSAYQAAGAATGGQGDGSAEKPTDAPAADSPSAVKGNAQAAPQPAAAAKNASDGAFAPATQAVADQQTKTQVNITATAAAVNPVTYTNVYRLYNPNSGEHFYTTSLSEATSVFSAGWRWEEAVYLEADKNGTAVYRLYNPNAGAHFYTTSQSESNRLRSLGWRYENIAFYSSGSNLLYRLYNPNSPIGEHLYTADASESDHLRSEGWQYEGYAWAFTPGRHNIAAQWVVSPAYGSMERYWLSNDTSLAKNRYIETNEGSGWRAYAKGDGAVVRGLYRTGDSSALIADNDGALETAEGMVVTGRYTNGSPERYFLRNGYVQLGEFSVDGRNYFGRYDTGYVVRGDYFDPNAGKMYRGDNDGVLQARNSSVDRYVDWALAIAKDNSHGYSQINRWGPNYDCSSMVISALRQAGYRTGSASYTGNMYSQLRRYGWYSLAPNAANLQYGDILLNDTHHTAIYLANGWLVQASSDENGSWEGYQSGDQTGREIWYRTYYNYPWTRFLRHA